MSLRAALKEVEEQITKAGGEVETHDNDTAGAGTDSGGDGEGNAGASREAEQDRGAGAGQDNDGRDDKGRFRKQDDKGKKADDQAAAGAEGEAAAGEQQPSNSDFARMRRDHAAAIKRAEEAERRAQENERKRQEAEARANQPKKDDNAAAVKDPEPNKETDPEAHLRWELRQAKEQVQSLTEWRKERDQQDQKAEARRQRDDMINRATDEFVALETEFQKTVPDYKERSAFFVSNVMRALAIANPGLKGPALQQATKEHLLRMAGQAVTQGYNPVEHMYHMATEWGYQPPAKGAEGEGGGKPAGDKKPAPSMKDIAANKKKSASSMAAGGKNGNTGLSRDHALSGKMSLSEFSRLTPEQLRHWEGMEGQS